MAGCPVLDRPWVAAIAETDLPRRSGPKLYLVRVTARTGTDGVLRVRSSGGQESHMLMVLAQANALALLPDGDTLAPPSGVPALMSGPVRRGTARLKSFHLGEKTGRG